MADSRSVAHPDQTRITHTGNGVEMKSVEFRNIIIKSVLEHKMLNTAAAHCTNGSTAVD